MTQRITIQVEDGVELSRAVYLVSSWIEKHNLFPNQFPLKGIVVCESGIKIARRDYRKGLCFIAWKEAGE